MLLVQQYMRDLVAGSVVDLPAYIDAAFIATGAKSPNLSGMSFEDRLSHPSSEIEARELFLDFIHNLHPSEWTENHRRFFAERAHDPGFMAAHAKALARGKAGRQARKPVFSRSQEFLIANWSLLYFLTEGEYRAEVPWKRVPGFRFWKRQAVLDLMVAMGFSEKLNFDPSLTKKCKRMKLIFAPRPFVHVVQVVGKSGRVSSKPDHIKLTVERDPRTLELSSYF